MIPNWAMESTFWLAVTSFIAVPTALFYWLHWLMFSGDKKDPEQLTVPAEVYRVVELREYIDPLWLKLYECTVDDFNLLRIDKALGRATVREYSVAIDREINVHRRPTLKDPAGFLMLARRAAIDAELSRGGDLNPSDVLELKQQLAKEKEPVHRS